MSDQRDDRDGEPKFTFSIPEWAGMGGIFALAAVFEVIEKTIRYFRKEQSK